MIGEDPELAAMMKAPLIHLADSTDDCTKTVNYEACIPALFGQGCTRSPLTLRTINANPLPELRAHDQ